MISVDNIRNVNGYIAQSLKNTKALKREIDNIYIKPFPYH